MPQQIAPGPELTIIIPTLNERDNIVPLYERLATTLAEVNWEAIFVDDDSSDGTRDEIAALAAQDRRVRLLHRTGRRGLASACIEGVQASTSPFAAVMDADLQHDESLLPKMLDSLRTEPIDVAVGSRYVESGGIGDWQWRRALASKVATHIGKYVLRVAVADPMSGFFMFRREVFRDSLRNLSGVGFKILIDLLASSPRPLRVKEIPFTFRQRHSGESKFDELVAWEYAVLLADKLVGRAVPIRFVLFALVGGAGILAHLLVLGFCLKTLGLTFGASQTIATGVAMIGNFVLNNWFTYRDRRLKGWNFVWGLLSFVLICSVGAVANVGIASLLLREEGASWWLAGIAGAVMSLVWNYAVSSIFTWRNVAR
jgi:dolichol-phosphate mannosyltransferase